MRPSLALAAAASAVLVASFAGTATAQPPEASAGAGEVAGSWIVVLNDDTSPGRVSDAHAQRYGAQVGHVYRHALRGYSARMSDTAAARVAADPRVASVQPDRVVSIAAPGGGKGKPKPEEPTVPPPPEESTQITPTGIDRANGDVSPTAAIGSGGEVDVDVAVIDTGVDLDHPDLNVHTAGAKNCSTGGSADDGNGHGTHVAGTIGALDNTSGVVGMAPGARIWPVRVLDNRGSGTWSSVICGIDFVTAHADVIDVANMSLGGGGGDDGSCAAGSVKDSMHLSICAAVEKGVTFVVAAGNEGVDANASRPATFPEVITVSALADFNGLPGGGARATCRSGVDDTFADFSNFGADVDLIAPGVCIESTWKGGGYNTISGTSMASPHVAGGAALWIATRTPTEEGNTTRPAPVAVRDALLAPCSATPLPENCGWTGDKDLVPEPLLDVSNF